MTGARTFAAAALLATLVFAATQATGAITKSSDTVQIGAAPDSDTAEAQCPRGKRVVSGGFSTPSFGDVAGSEISPVSSRRSGGRTWSSSAFNDEEEPGAFTGYAYCDADAPRLRERTAEVELPDSGTGDGARARAACRPQERLVSGGFSSPEFAPGDEIWVSESRKSGQGWAATGRVLDGSGQTFVVHAYCSKKAPRLKTVRRTEEVGTGSNVHSDTARCPRRRPLVSGGFMVPAEGAFIRLYQSRRQGRRTWLATSLTISGTLGDLLTVEAYCGPKRR